MNPTVPDKFTNVTTDRVFLESHVVVGANSVILPGVIIGKGCAVGALSLVKRNLDPFGVYVGAPVKRIKERSKKLLELEKKYLHGSEGSNK